MIINIGQFKTFNYKDKIYCIILLNIKSSYRKKKKQIYIEERREEKHLLTRVLKIDMGLTLTSITKKKHFTYSSYVV